MVQNIFISIINNAFESLKTRPVGGIDDDSDKEEEPNEEEKSAEAPSLVLRRATRRNTKQELGRTAHTGLKSQKIFHHLISHNFGIPFAGEKQEIEDNTAMVIDEMDTLEGQITKLMYEIRDKAIEEPKDGQAVNRFKEIIQVDLPKLLEDVLRELT